MVHIRIQMLYLGLNHPKNTNKFIVLLRKYSLIVVLHLYEIVLNRILAKQNINKIIISCPCLQPIFKHLQIVSKNKKSVE